MDNYSASLWRAARLQERQHPPEGLFSILLKTKRSCADAQDLLVFRYKKTVRAAFEHQVTPVCAHSRKRPCLITVAVLLTDRSFIVSVRSSKSSLKEHSPILGGGTRLAKRTLERSDCVSVRATSVANITRQERAQPAHSTAQDKHFS